jgi:hypothetical protein
MMATYGAGQGLSGLAGGYFGYQGAQDLSNSIGQGINSANNSFNQGIGYLNPYNQGGQQAFGQLGSSLNSMANPGGYVNNLMQQYQTSPMAKFQMNAEQQTMNNSSAAGGMLGSPQEQQQMAQYAQGLTSQDMQNYIGNAMNVNQQYLGGLSGMAGMGLNAASNMNQNRMGLGNTLANMYANQGLAQQSGQNSIAGGIGGVLSGITSMF